MADVLALVLTRRSRTILLRLIMIYGYIQCVCIYYRKYHRQMARSKYLWSGHWTLYLIRMHKSWLQVNSVVAHGMDGCVGQIQRPEHQRKHRVLNSQRALIHHVSTVTISILVWLFGPVAFFTCSLGYARCTWLWNLIFKINLLRISCSCMSMCVCDHALFSIQLCHLKKKNMIYA